METTRVKFLGMSDNGACDCCGREGLKHTVKVDLGDRVSLFGVGCAAKALGMDVKAVRTSARKADDDRATAEALAQQTAHMAEMARWQAFLDARLPALRGERLAQIQALGGIAAARAAYAVAA